MLTLFPRRLFRRPLFLVFLLISLILLSSNVRDLAYYAYEARQTRVQQQVEPKTILQGQGWTVTKTHTAWARTTRTVYHAYGEPTQGAGGSLEDGVHQPEGARNVDAADGQAPIPKPPLGPLGEHRYREDGLLEVNLHGSHPIYELVRRAEKEWKDKLDRASKTLDEAVLEYEKRYKRAPPKGFDDWWEYVQKHDVQLPDEYDQIYHDLEPYWGMNPKDLHAIELEWEGHEDSFTLGKTSPTSPLDMVNYSLPDRGGNTGLALANPAYDVIDLLKEVEAKIPPFRAVFSPHDNPNLPTDWELKEMALKAAAAGTYIDINNPPPVKLDGWISACSPTSPAWQRPINHEAPPRPLPPTSPKTFIYNHRSAMDPCLHPDHLLLHGQFLSHHKGPVPHRRMVPQFSYCPTMLHHDIMAAMPINWVGDIEPRSNDPLFREKGDARLEWRGSNTGIWHDKGNNRWWDAQRARLIRWAEPFGVEIPWGGKAYEYPEDIRYLVPWKEEGESMKGEIGTANRAKWNPAMLDVAFAGNPLSCPEEVCHVLGEMFEYRRPHNVRAQGRYKYILDVDGNGWSSRFKRLITSNSLIFKSTIYPEWYTDRIQPWVHYVPIQVSLSDLHDSLLFFRGDPTGRGSHEDMGANIAWAGRDWSKRFWRREDLTAYMFRSFLEYARVMSLERDVDMEGVSYLHWKGKTGEKEKGDVEV
ncbi:hypothetical protein BDN72DRAFT_798290 [Pluteus cervinus]|uniref:Uncharacterized protein n=1 Tax=Pluteus cervinus TaxID=181527 RepID=A0ACD3AQY2_9AGAR|nr:hypothetical protein BDN72DRAFT_798290 [Pluteus cervinus]